MSTQNICFHGEIRKISAFFCWKKIKKKAFPRAMQIMTMHMPVQTFTAYKESTDFSTTTNLPLGLCYHLYHSSHAARCQDCLHSSALSVGMPLLPTLHLHLSDQGDSRSEEKIIVDSRYLEFQETLWNTSRYLYLDISEFQNWRKNNLNNHI